MAELRAVPPAAGPDRTRLAAAAVRAVLAALCLALTLGGGHPSQALLWLGPLVLLGAGASTRRSTGVAWHVLVVAEVGFAGVAIGATGGARSLLLPYLLAPLFAAGFRAGARMVVLLAGWLAAVLLAGLRLDVATRGGARDYVVAVAEWTVLALALGLVAAWARSLYRLAALGPAQGYEVASRLLAELRGVARRLPGSLDPVTAADALLDRCRDVAPYDRAAVLLAGSGTRLNPLVVRGTDRLDLDLVTTGPGLVAEVWTSGLAAVAGDRDVRSGMRSLLIVPLPRPGGPPGLVTLESVRDNAYGPAEVAAVARAAAEASARLDSALLFDEIRGLATVEERQRLAREIHDGIAQELVYIGYELDNLTAEVGERRVQAAESVKRVRGELTRIISELRLSIFNLRTTVDPQAGLGAALSEYVRSVGSRAGIRVHLSLEESADRLPADVETELLRIAQEAVGNARKHASARNLWVTLTVEPPQFCLTVEDDGTGVAEHGRQPGFGLEIMSERAARLGALLTVRPRDPAGTSVDVRSKEAGR
jgi:signal transduction histidine kinase